MPLLLSSNVLHLLIKVEGHGRRIEKGFIQCDHNLPKFRSIVKTISLCKFLAFGQNFEPTLVILCAIGQISVKKWPNIGKRI